jgi:hypothetical protein
MNLLNLIEDITAGYDNLRALMQAVQSGQDAVLNIGGETITLDSMEVRWIYSKYKAFLKAGRQEEFLNHLADPVKFDQHMRQLRDLIDRQKNFQGSVPGQRGVTGDVPQGMAEAEPVPGKYTGHFYDAKILPNGDYEVVKVNSKKDDQGRTNPMNLQVGSVVPKRKAHAIQYTTDGGMFDQLKETDALEEISMVSGGPGGFTKETAGKINFERMIQDYKENRPYSEFEFPGDRPLTLYRSQVFAILKDFGRIKPPQKINLILTVFGDKTNMVAYLDKLRSKGMIPKKVPAYVAPGTEPVSPNQMALPGLEAAKIKESQVQKKKSYLTELDTKSIVNPKVARAFQLARARQSAAGSDIEAFVKDELEKAEQSQADIDQLKQDNAAQDQQMQQLAQLIQQQDQQIQQIKPVAPTSSVRPADPVSRKPALEPREPKADEPKQPSTAEKPAEPATQPQQQPSATARPVPATPAKPAKKPPKKPLKKPPKKPAATTPPPDNVIVGPWSGAASDIPNDDNVLTALTGLDFPGTGTYGLREGTQELNVGDPVIISGNVEHAGKTGDVSGFGRDKHFVIVDLYNFGKHAFHASNVQYNDYADEEDYVEEMQTKLDRSSVNQPPPGGSNKQREAFLDARDRLFRQMQSASPGEKEAIRLKIADLEGRAQAQGIRIRESNNVNRSGYNAIKSVSDWQEKMRVMRELQKDQALMADPEARSAIEQRIGDLIRVGQQQGYVSEALNDKAMAVLRSLQQPAQPAPAAVDLNVPAGPRRGRPTNAQRAQRHEEFLTLRRRIALLDELIKMKEQIDNLFLKAQNVRGGIYPGLQADIEMEELYPVPETDRQFQDLRDKYTKDLAALQKFLAMKKAVYREDEDLMLGESTALVRLKQARQALSQQGVAEDAEPMDREFALVKKLGRLGERIVQNPKLWNKYSEVVESNDPDWIISLIQDGTGATYKEVLRLSDLFGEIGGGLGRIIDFAWAVKEGTWEEDFLTPYRKYRSEWDLAEAPTDYQKRRQRERDVDAGRPVKALPKNAKTDYQKKREQDRRDQELGESLRPGEYHVATVTLDNGDVKKIKVTSDEGYTDAIRKHYAAKGRTVVDIDMDFSIHSNVSEQDRSDQSIPAKSVIQGYTVFYDPKTKTVSVTRGGVDAEAAIEQARISQPTMLAFRSAVDRMINKIETEQGLAEGIPFDQCPKCGGSIVHESQLSEKQDACYHKVKSRYKVWPSAYASGALVQCRKKGAANWGNGGKKQ